jgi:hypothetical protein
MVPAIHGVVRWRLIDLAPWLFEEPRLVVSKQPPRRGPRNMGPRQARAAAPWPTAQAASADSPAAGQRNREHGDPDGKGADKRKTRENRRGDCLW